MRLEGGPDARAGSASVTTEVHSGLGVRSSRECQYTALDSTASVASRSFLTLATAACACFPVNRVMSRRSGWPGRSPFCPP